MKIPTSYVVMAGRGLLAILVVLVAFSPAFSQSRTALVYSAVSIQDREATIAAHKDVVATLSAAIGSHIQIVYEVDQRKVVTDFVNGRIDIAYFGPLSYVAMARRYSDYEILAVVNEEDGRPHYRCALVRAFDGPARIGEIDGTIALTNPLSTCGYLATSVLLRRHGLDIEQLPYSFVGTHDDVALAVIRGEYVVGGVKDSVARKYAGLLLEVMATSDLLPGQLLIANRATLTEEQIVALRRALTHAEPAEKARWGIGATGFSIVSQVDYLLIDEMMTPSFEEQFMEMMP
jgi:phosphonate transport system substrate-binding protein